MKIVLAPLALKPGSEQAVAPALRHQVYFSESSSQLSLLTRDSMTGEERKCL